MTFKAVRIDEGELPVSSSLERNSGDDACTYYFGSGSTPKESGKLVANVKTAGLALRMSVPGDEGCFWRLTNWLNCV